jgi:NAD+ diphosphatase
MIGFHARYVGGELRPDGVEIVEADWFRRDALPLLPPPISIARRLIEEFLARERASTA